ncbi:hypothetical protein JCM30566_19950 [Marinitoga arctica]
MEKLKQQLEIIRMKGMKPNFSELGRIYGYDRRTIKNIRKDMKGNHKKERRKVNWIII